MLRSRAIPVTFRFYLGFALAALVGAVTAALGSNDSDSHHRPHRSARSPSAGRAASATTSPTPCCSASPWSPASSASCSPRSVTPTPRPSPRSSTSRRRRSPGPRLGANYWPIVSRLRRATVLIGLSISTPEPRHRRRLVARRPRPSCGPLRAWAERATGDEQANVELYQQFVEPLRIPVLSIVLIGILAIGFSRVLLALPNTKSLGRRVRRRRPGVPARRHRRRPPAPPQPLDRRASALRTGPGHHRRRHRAALRWATESSTSTRSSQPAKRLPPARAADRWPPKESRCRRPRCASGSQP